MRVQITIACICFLTANAFAQVETTALGSASVAAAYNSLVSAWMGGGQDTMQNKCGFPAVTYALQHRHELPSSLRLSLAVVLSRPATQKSILAGSFRIHFDTIGVNAPAILDSNGMRIPGTSNQFADSVAAVLRHVLRFETDSLGYLPPPPDNGMGGGNEYDVYIQELGGSSYGSTTPEVAINNKPDGGTFTSFIVIDNDFDFVSPARNRGLPALRVTIAHELHHAIQIGNYGYWQNDRYFYEMTSVWLEDVLYTDVNDYYQYLRGSPGNPGHFLRPDISFTSNSFIMYSRGVWCHYLAKRFGRDVILRMWEEIRNARPLTAMDAALASAPYGATLRSAFAEWGAWNYFTKSRSDSILYYPEGAYYPEIVPALRDYTPPQRTIEDQVNPFGSRYYSITSSQGQTLTLVVTNLNTQAALNQNTTPFSYSLLLNQNRPDESYLTTGANIFVKISVGDPTNWFVKDLFGVPTLDEVFPNPFISDGRGMIRFPINSILQQTGTLTVFSSSMDLVFTAQQLSETVPHLGRQAFGWNGRTLDGNLAASGVYFYVLETPLQTLRGKFVVVRK